jgi:hypothetical protein
MDLTKDQAMSPVDIKQRAGAMMMAISITLAIVWALSSYAYRGPPPAGFSGAVSKIAPAKTCS